jgi:hypothetical protein
VWFDWRFISWRLRIADGNGAGRVHPRRAAWALGGNGCSWAERGSGRAHGWVDNLFRFEVSIFVRPSVSLLLSLLFIEQILLSNPFGADGFALSLTSCSSSGGGSIFLGSAAAIFVSAATIVNSFARLAFLGVLLLGSILFPLSFLCLSLLAVEALFLCLTSNGGRG